jgi:hypothetical protein
MSQFGLTVKSDSGGHRVEVECKHQNGLIYVVPSEASWVCTDELRHAHSLAGFFKDLVELDEPRVRDAMQRWGVYFRPRPLAADPEEAADPEAPSEPEAAKPDKAN